MAGRDFKSCVARSARFFSQRKLGWRYKASSRASLASFLAGSWDDGGRLQVMRRSLRSLLFSEEAGMAIQGCKSCVARCARFCSRRQLGWRGRLRVSGRSLRSLLSRRLASFLGAVCACGCVRLRALCVLFALFGLQGHAPSRPCPDTRAVRCTDATRGAVAVSVRCALCAALCAHARSAECSRLSRTARPRRLGVPADLSERGMLSRTALPRRLGVSADLSALNI